MKIGMRHLHLFILLFAMCSLLFQLPSEAFAADGDVSSTVAIASDTTNGPSLASGDLFGTSIANIGDLNGDGVNDLAVGAPNDDEGGDNRGAVHIMFMNTDGSVDSTAEINDSTTNGPSLEDTDRFGNSIANIGDLDGDGVNDLAVGAYLNDETSSNSGAVHIMFMNTDGSVDSTVEINDSTTNGPTIGNGYQFGSSIANIGDLDGDGVNDLAVGTHLDPAGGSKRGTVNIMFMNTDGSVKSTVEIDDTTTNGPTLSDNDRFGSSIANIGDLDADGVNDLAVGAHYDDEGGDNRGAVHIIFMNTDGSVDSTAEINDSTTNGPSLADSDNWGISVASIGDLNDDGVDDLAVGATGAEHGTPSGFNSAIGIVFIMFMNTDGSVDSTVEINSSTTNGFGDLLTKNACCFYVGTSVANIGDLNDDGVDDLAVGATSQGTGGTVFITFMVGSGTTAPTITITSSSGDSGDTVDSTTLSYTATFNESVSNFVVGDITVTGTANDGSPAASNFAGSGTTYTFDVVQGSSDGTVIVYIAADTATDTSTNKNSASNTYTLTVKMPISGTCSRHVILGNCGTIAINNDEYRIINTWTNVPTTEVLVGQPVTVTLSTPNNPTHTKIHFASVHTEVFSIPANFDQTAHIDYSIMNNQVTYVSQSQIFQVAGATHRIVQDPDMKNLEMFEVVFTMIFAKPMDTSHVVVETENKYGIPETLYLIDALKVSNSIVETLTLEQESKFELIYEPGLEVDPEQSVYTMSIDPESEMDPEPPMEPDVKNVTCGKGTVLKDNLCVPKEWSFLDFFQFMKMFG